MIELHIWGPGFTLPSIDPLCLATISYLNLTLPKNSWSLVASSNPLLSPTKSLPALRDNGTWVSGFAPIVEYLAQKIPVSLDADNLDQQEAAKCVAYTAFITSRAQEILDLSLYVSHANFTSATRPLYSRLLPFPVQYYLPLPLRSAAKTRTEYLGLGSIDVEPTKEASMADSPAARATAAEKLVREANTPTLILKSSPQTKANIRLASICDDFLETLTKRLGDNKYLFGSQVPSSLDCIAVGYLAMMLVPHLPHNFAYDAMKRHPRLAAYVHDLRSRFLGPAVDVDEVLRGDAKGDTSLPWAKVEKGDLPWLTGVFFDAAKMAVTEPVRRATIKKEDEEDDDDDDPMIASAKRKARETQRKEWWKSLGVVTGGVLSFVGYLFYVGIVRLESNPEEKVEEATEVPLTGTSAEDILSFGIGNENTRAPVEKKDDDEDVEVHVVQEDDDDDEVILPGDDYDDDDE